MVRIDGKKEKQVFSGADSGTGIFPGAKPFESFVSPVDGSVVRNHRELQDHNKRNGVVLSNEFTPEFYERKRKEREQVFSGERSREEVFRARQEIYESIVRAERNV